MGLFLEKNSMKLYVEKVSGKKLTAEEEKLLKQLDSRTRFKKLSEVKLLKLSISCSSVFSFGEWAGALL